MRMVSTGRPRSPGNISHLDDDSLVGLYLACRVPGISRKEGGGRVGYWRQEKGRGRREGLFIAGAWGKGFPGI